MSSTTNPVIETSQAATVQYQSNSENKEKSGTGATTTSTQSGTRVFIRNIPFKTTSEELKAHLITATPNVLSTEIISYSSGRSKGCGLAEFKSVADVEKVINSLNNMELGGRKIFLFVRIVNRKDILEPNVILNQLKSIILQLLQTQCQVHLTQLQRVV